MKKVLVLIFAFMLSVSSVAEIDLSGMTYDALVELRKKVDLAIWASDSWQEAVVPAGVYGIGSDIPEGRWSITSDAIVCVITTFPSEEAAYSNSLNESQAMYVLNAHDTCNVTLKNGQFIQITNGPAVFTPFISASLGFK